MRKYGKYEKRPETTQKSPPKMKGTLLQAYFTGLISLLLCVGMFLGTSYAWFTGDITSNSNEIYIGILKADLFAGDTDLSVAGNKLYDDSVYWEPGHTELETIRVINKGNLAFKYVLNFTDGALAAGSSLDLQSVAENFDVWVYDHQENAEKSGVVPTPADFAQLTASGSGWYEVGSLADILAGRRVFDGEMDAVCDDDAGTPVVPGTQNGVASEHKFTVALHMREDASADVMGYRISLSVKLTAYQMSSETDGFGSSYDQMVASEEELRTALENGGIVALASDITLEDSLTVPAGKAVVLDLNSYSLSHSYDCTQSYSMINNSGNLTITGNGVISFEDTGPGVASGTFAISNDGTLVIENGTIKHVGQQVGNMNNAIFQNSGVTVINGGTISAPYSRAVRVLQGDLTISDGVFNGQVWIQTQHGAPASLTIHGGTFTPTARDTASVYVTNNVNSCALAIDGGVFQAMVGVSDPNADGMDGCITGGTFTDQAKNDMAANLFANNFG